MLTCFPTLKQDEILCSGNARFHDRMCYSSDYATIENLCGDGNAGVTVELPTRLSNLVANLPPELEYTVDEFIDDHTMLPFYKPFLSSNRILKMREKMSGAEGGNEPSSGNIVLPNNLTKKQLDFCPVCVREDRQHFKFCYWHRAHQAFGVEVCANHQVWLEQSSVKTNPKSADRKRYISAEKAVTAVPPRYLDLSNFSHQILLNIARDVTWLLEAKVDFDFETLQERYLTELIKRGLASSRGVIRKKQFVQEINAYYPSGLLDLFRSPIDESIHQPWPVQVVRSGHRSQSPIRNLLVIYFLGYRVKEFFSLPLETKSIKSKPVETKHFRNGRWLCLNITCDHYRQPVSEEPMVVFNGGCYKGIVACSCGFVYSSSDPYSCIEDRPGRSYRVEAFGPVWEAKLKKLWADSSIGVQGISHELQVSWKTVIKQAERLGLPFPRKSPQGHQVNLTKPSSQKVSSITSFERRDLYRETWKRARKENPEAPISDLVKSYASEYNWLNYNDKEWLETNMPPRKEKTPSPRRLDWEALDRELAEKIPAAVLRIKNAPGRPKQVTINAIADDLGTSYLQPKNFKNLPLSAQLLSSVVETREDFIIRRIFWATEYYRKEKILPSPKQFKRYACVEPYANQPIIKSAIDAALQSLAEQFND